MGSKIIQTSLHVIEGDIQQYNILLGRPWIREIECVPYALHGFLKYIHEGIFHCVLRVENPYLHYNITQRSKTEFNIENLKRKTTFVSIKGLFQTMSVSYSILREITPSNNIYLGYKIPIQQGHHCKDKRCEVKSKEDYIDEMQSL